MRADRGARSAAIADSSFSCVIGARLHQRDAVRSDLVDQLCGRAVRALIQQEHRLEVGLGSFHQLTAAGDDAGRHVLMRPDDAGRRRFQRHRADEAALQHPARGGLAVRTGADLLVDIQRGLIVWYQDPVGLPPAQVRRGVLVRAAGLTRWMAGKDETDDVVRVGSYELVLDVCGNHVVRWRGDLGEPAHPVLGITDAPEGREH
jgi:hypothetical protein